MNSKLKISIYRIIKETFQHHGMPKITIYKNLTKKNFLNHVYEGLLVYFTVLESVLSKQLNYKYHDNNSKLLRISLHRFQMLQNGTTMKELKNNENNLQALKHIKILLNQAKNFFYPYQRYILTLRYDNSNKFHKTEVIKINHIKFYFNPSNTMANEILNYYIPNLQGNQQFRIVSKDRGKIHEL